MNSKQAIALKAVSDVLVILAVALAFLLQGLQLFGLKPYSVLSGSMQSVYPTGSLLYIQKVNPEMLEVGDVITYKMGGGTLCTHRIVEIVPDEHNPDEILFLTKGDENDITDPLVEKDDVVGKAVFCIPHLGRFASDISQPPGKYIAISVAALFILAEIMISILLGDHSKNKSKSRKSRKFN